MSEYIGRNALLSHLNDWWLSETPNAQHGQSARLQSRTVCAAIRMAMKAVEEQPTADVAPVRHGRWNGRENLVRTGAVHCSLCGSWESNVYPYCHMCGAKMDGGGNDEN